MPNSIDILLGNNLPAPCPAGDGNAFSYHYRSRLDISRNDGTRVRCEDLRAGCPALAPDGGAPYSYRELVTVPDS